MIFENYEESGFILFKKIIYSMFHVDKIYKITHLEIKFNFSKNALHYIQNSFL